MYEKGLLEVKTDQKRTILAKKSVFRTSGGKPDQSISSGPELLGGVIIIDFWNFDPIPWEMIH